MDTTTQLETAQRYHRIARRCLATMVAATLVMLAVIATTQLSSTWPVTAWFAVFITSFAAGVCLTQAAYGIEHRAARQINSQAPA